MNQIYILTFFPLPLPPPASFYGDGFVHLKAAESSERNVLRVRFRTSSTAGLLFLAAGRTDYFLLELYAGRLQVGTSVARAHQYSLATHTHAHTCTHTRANMHTHTHTHTHSYIPVCMNAHEHMNIDA